MRSKYSIRLYEILKSNAHLQQFIMTIDNIKKQLQTAEYDAYKDFRKRVLETAIEEINSLSDIYVSFVPIRESRKIVSIKFVIQSKDTTERLLTFSRLDKRRNTHYE